MKNPLDKIIEHFYKVSEESDKKFKTHTKDQEVDI